MSQLSDSQDEAQDEQQPDAAASRPGLADNGAVILATCFLEGVSVLIVEIAGARALAPFFGTSLVVWTSQITATLLFLALGYHLGGRLSRHWKSWYLPTLFWSAGFWLCLFPILRDPVLRFSAETFGLAGGSLISAIVMFGPPLGCFGAVSPVLIEHWNRRRAGAGNAAGNIFFVNTLGGLAGAWLTALVLVPGVSMRVSMTATGLAVAALGLVWWFLLPRTSRLVPAGVAGALLLLTAASPQPLRSFETPGGRVEVILAQRSWVGLIQVVENAERHWRAMLIDGVTQGGIDTRYGYSFYAFAEYMNVMGHRYHPEAERALVLGLGPGVVARQLVDRGVSVEAIELDGAVVDAARNHFGLPDAVVVHLGDARELLRSVRGRFDLVMLDTFTGENTPWHVVTREGLRAIRAKLKPDGRILVNAVSDGPAGSPGLDRLEAALLDTFGEARVYIGPTADDGLAQAVLVAGTELRAQSAGFPGRVAPRFRGELRRLRNNGRDARAGARVGTDDHSDLDYADSALRTRWRESVMAKIPVRVLAD